MSDSLGKFRTAWTERLPEGSPARALNFPLIHFLVVTFGYKGEEFAQDLARGMPIVGAIPVSNVSQTRVRPQTMTEGQWSRGLYERNLQNVERT